MQKLPDQFFITEQKIIDAVAAAKKLPPNSGIILRDYDLSFEERLALGKKLKKICAAKKFVLLVANSPKLALLLKADGVHFPEYAIIEAKRWRAKKPQWLITTSAHSKSAVIQGFYAKSDAVLISPVFKSTSHTVKKAIRKHAD